MDLGLSEEQELLRNFARDFLEKECPEKVVRDMEEDEKGYPPELWQKMAEQGWQGLVIPPEHGGSGMTFVDLIILLEEFGRALVPGPFIPSVIGGAIPIMEMGSEEQKKEFLPKLASGEMIMTLALTEPTARFDAEGVELEAKAEGGAFVLNGTTVNVLTSPHERLLDLLRGPLGHLRRVLLHANPAIPKRLVGPLAVRHRLRRIRNVLLERRVARAGRVEAKVGVGSRKKHLIKT
jgi:alkylation response protein AidB-like acyl-CoA dehydrogenase